MTGRATLTFDVVEPRIGIVTFNTQDRLNSLTEQRLADIEAVLGDVEAYAALGALILHGGVGNAFCVGLDLELFDRAFNDIAYFESVVRRLNGIVLRLEALRIPTIAAVNGLRARRRIRDLHALRLHRDGDEARIGDVHTDAGVLPACTTS